MFSCINSELVPHFHYHAKRREASSRQNVPKCSAQNREATVSSDPVFRRQGGSIKAGQTPHDCLGDPMARPRPRQLAQIQAHFVFLVLPRFLAFQCLSPRRWGQQTAMPLLWKQAGPWALPEKAKHAIRHPPWAVQGAKVECQPQAPRVRDALLPQPSAAGQSHLPGSVWPPRVFPVQLVLTGLGGPAQLAVPGPCFCQ